MVRENILVKLHSIRIKHKRFGAHKLGSWYVEIRESNKLVHIRKLSKQIDRYQNFGVGILSRPLLNAY